MLLLGQSKLTVVVAWILLLLLGGRGVGQIVWRRGREGVHHPHLGESAIARASVTFGVTNGVVGGIVTWHLRRSHSGWRSILSTVLVQSSSPSDDTGRGGGFGGGSRRAWYHDVALTGGPLALLVPGSVPHAMTNVIQSI